MAKRCPCCHLMMSSVSPFLSGRCFSEEEKKPAVSSLFSFMFCICHSLFLFFSFVNDYKKRPAFKCSGRFQSHLNRFLKTSVGELVLPFLPFETADFLENL